MADPIMDLFDDSSLFNLDSLQEDTFSQGSSDPVEEALKLALGQVDPPLETDSAPESGIAVLNDSAQAPLATTTATSSVQHKTQAISQVALSSISSSPLSIQAVPQPSVSMASSNSGSTAVLFSSPIAVSGSQVASQQLQPQHLLTQQTGGQAAPKIVILKSPQGQAQVLQSVAGTAGTAGKLTIARVVTGAPVRPGMSFVSGGTVLNATQSGQVKVGTGVQRLVQTPNGPVKQVLLTSLPQTHVQLPTQITQTQTELQLQPQVQPAQVPIQAQVQDHVAVTTGSTVAAQTQGVTLSTVAQQVRVFFFCFFLQPSICLYFMVSIFISTCTIYVI